VSFTLVPVEHIRRLISIWTASNRNSPIPCNLISTLDAEAWVSDLPVLQVPDDLLRQSIERAMTDMNKRRADEVKLFLASKCKIGQLVTQIPQRSILSFKKKKAPIPNRQWASRTVSIARRRPPFTCLTRHTF
jgi:hypothetical protein